MQKRTILSKTDITAVVENNSVLIRTHPDKPYRRVYISKHCNLRDKNGKFDPSHYVLLQKETYECIVDAYAVEIKPVLRPVKAVMPMSSQIGRSIHLHSKNGTYQIYGKIRGDQLTITCNKWITLYRSGQRKTPFEVIPLTDVKK